MASGSERFFRGRFLEVLLLVGLCMFPPIPEPRHERSGLRGNWRRNAGPGKKGAWDRARFTAPREWGGWTSSPSSGFIFFGRQARAVSSWNPARKRRYNNGLAAFSAAALAPGALREMGGLCINSVTLQEQNAYKEREFSYKGRAAAGARPIAPCRDGSKVQHAGRSPVFVTT